MYKILGFSLRTIFNYIFTVITGYCYIDVARLLLPFTDVEILDLKTTGSLIVVGITGLYWIFRLFIIIMEIPYKKREREMNERIMKLRHDREIDRIKREIRQEEIDKLLKNDR